MQILTDAETRQLITIKDAIMVVKETLEEFGKKKTVMPPRSVIDVQKANGTTLFMPAYLPKNGGMGIKIVSVYPKNEQHGLPTICGIILLNNSQTGEVLSIMEANYVTSLRTGACSAVATDILANKEAKIIGLFGAGVQGRSQLEAIMAVRNIERVYIYDLDDNKAKMFALEMEKHWKGNCIFIPVNNPREVTDASEIIVTATTSKTPVLNGGQIKEGTHISAIGAFKPKHREIDIENIECPKIFVDSYADCLREAGDIIIPLKCGLISKDDIRAEISDVILGKKPGREHSKDITLFKSVGLAILDIAIAQKIFVNWIKQKNLH
jgi:ornithine cyclodeaminase